MPNKIFNNQILNKQVQFSTDFGGNNVAKFVDIQIIVNTLILKFEIAGKHDSIDILFMVMNSAIFVWHLGQHVRLNTTCGYSVKCSLSIFHNPETYTNGYSIHVCTLCVTGNGGVSECYNLFLTYIPWLNVQLHLIKLTAIPAQEISTASKLLCTSA